MRHKFHSICPYFAMFPEHFVQKHLAWSRPGDLVMDPFSGRGTTIFESLLNDRRAIGCDTNAVAVCLSNAKANPPEKAEVISRLKELKELPFKESIDEVWADPFFQACFHQDTLSELLHLRQNLRWRQKRSDCFIAALVLGSLHGESHRSKRYFSNRMPRTISTKPSYSIRWWNEHNCIAPRREVFKIIREQIDFRFQSEPAKARGRVKMVDARKADKAFNKNLNQVNLVITSPPYLDTTNFEEDQWLRLWFLGGASRPTIRKTSDDRHTQKESYWKFLRDAWSGISPLLRDDAKLVIRIGGKKLQPQQIRLELLDSLKSGLNRPIRLVDETISDITRGQLQVFRPGIEGSKREYDFRFSLS